jgi:hypothetical protein
MWMLIVTTIWAISGGVDAKNLRVFEKESDCKTAKVALERGYAIDTHSSEVNAYSCLPVPKP